MQSNTRDTHAQKIILITGASCGSGAATARLLAQQGAHLGNRNFKRSFAAGRSGFREAAAGIAPGRGKLGLGKALGEKWKVTGHRSSERVVPSGQLELLHQVIDGLRHSVAKRAGADRNDLDHLLVRKQLVDYNINVRCTVAC